MKIGTTMMMGTSEWVHEYFRSVLQKREYCELHDLDQNFGASIVTNFI